MIFWLRYSVRSLIRRYKKSLILFLGFSFSLMILVFLGSLMTGVNDTMIANALTLHSGYITVRGGSAEYDDAAAGLDELAAVLAKACPEAHILERLTVPAILSAKGISFPVLLNGVIPEREAGITPIFAKMEEGLYLEDSGILLSRRTAEAAKIGIGDNILLMTSGFRGLFRISGIYNTGIERFDSTMLFLRKNEMGRISASPISYGTSLFLENNDDLEIIVEKARQAVDRTSVKGWDEEMPDIYQLALLNRTAMYIMIALVVLIIGFSMTNVLLTSVLDREKQFAVMKALGVGKAELGTIIFGEALILSLASGVVGSFGGALLSLIFSSTGGIDISVYTSFNPNFAVNSVIIPRLTPQMTIFPALISLFIGTSAASLPLFKMLKRSVYRGMRSL